MSRPDRIHLALTDVLPGETTLRADGTLWSHAATLGEFVQGDVAFSIDADTLERIVANFATGYPQKVPVDYEHETAVKDVNRALVPYTTRAGEIVEVRAVLTAADLLPEMQAQIDAEKARAAKLGSARTVALDPLGLWVRWAPTQRALSMVKAREVTEMSVVIAWDYPNKTTGAGQGPTLLSVALTNTPFLDTMIPVAASRRAGAERSASADQERSTMDNKPSRLMLALSALIGKPVATDEEAEAQIATLTAQVTEGKKATTALAMLTTELGEQDPAKALGVIRTLKAHAKAAEEAAATGQTAAIDAFLTANEARIGSVPAREHFKAALTAEAKAAPTTKVAELPSAKVVLSFPPSPMLGRKAGVDANDANVTDDRDVLLDRQARKLVADDAELKELASKRGFNEAYAVALKRAMKDLPEENGQTVTKS